MTDEPESPANVSCESAQPTSEVRPATEQAIIIGFITCFVSLIFSYWIEKPIVGMIRDASERTMAYSFVPALLTFAFLYRSRWHPEIKNAVRACRLLLISGIILSATLLAIPVLLCVVWLIVNALTGGSHP